MPTWRRRQSKGQGLLRGHRWWREPRAVNRGAEVEEPARQGPSASAHGGREVPTTDR
jgi:hypothetical protein